MGGNLFVPSDLERSDSVSSLGGDGSLTGKLLEDLGGTGKSVTRFTDGDVFWRMWVVGEEGGRSGTEKKGRGSVTSPSWTEREKDILMTSFSIRSSFIGLTAAVFSA